MTEREVARRLDELIDQVRRERARLDGELERLEAGRAALHPDGRAANGHARNGRRHRSSLMERAFEEIGRHPGITAADLAVGLGVNRNHGQNLVSRLKKAGRVRKTIGEGRGGYVQASEEPVTTA